MKKISLVALVMALAASSFGMGASSPAVAASGEGGPQDAVVVAILDFGAMPYHWDFLASKMPQNTDGNPGNDLPLNRAPHRWLPGFPSPSKEFASYNELKLSLDEKNADAQVAALSAQDQPVWQKVQPSTPKKLNYYWIPNTKIIGALSFTPSGSFLGGAGDHGVGTTSSAVGNIHGTCPECLLFFIQLGSVEDSEAAIDWAMDQPWIDAISNSYGFSLAYRDRLYSGSNVEAQLKASERGQTVFFSAGNGQDGAFVAPNTTVFSSQEGPDWVVTVGAVSPAADNEHYSDPIPRTSDHASYSGHGKPSDIAGIGSDYPTAYTSPTVGGTGPSGFGGTSNATPQVAGTYARALYEARTAMKGPSRIQSGGVIAKGAYKCGSKRGDCELKDGKLTAVELRSRLFWGAEHTAAGVTAAGYGEAPPIGEEEFLNEGHGSYFGLELGRSAFLKEFARIVGPLFGTAKPMERPEGELEWMIVDSYCRQNVWGSWTDGYYVDGKTELPPDDPAYPMRTSFKNSCPAWQPPP